MKVIKIPYITELPCSVHEVCEPENENCMDELKALIGIEWAELVLTRIKGEDPRRDYCLIVDEVGKMKDHWQDKINWRASFFYAGTAHGDPIVGDVVLCAREWTESFGECDLARLTDLEEMQILNLIS